MAADPSKNKGPAADLSPVDRPGVPMETAPAPVATAQPPTPQVPTVTILRRADARGLTPVFGTSTPPRGLSGLVKRLAYKFADHQAPHWLLLMLSDRIDVAEGKLLRNLPQVAAGALLTAGVVMLRRRQLL